MTSPDNELEQLRRRAYGRQADIHLDAPARERLRQLEGERNAMPTSTERHDAVEPSAPVVEKPAPVEHEPQVHDAPLGRKVLHVLREWAHWIARLRRSTVVIALSVLAVVAAIIVTLTLVQRVQTDPLQAGATQIARLAPDTAYRIPDIFGGPGGGGHNTEAYQPFHGLRPVVSNASFIPASRTTSFCLSIYIEDDITDPSSTSFSGQFFDGCAAGTFPAVTQFDPRTDGLPAGLRNAVSPWTALQFVYDKRDDEVVVFGSK